MRTPLWAEKDERLLREEARKGIFAAKQVKKGDRGGKRRKKGETSIIQISNHKI